MYNLFYFAIGVRLVAFIVFVACVYAGNLLFAKMERRQSKLLWKITFVTLYSIFLLLITYVVWFVFYFGLNA
ncbi:membrane protein [Streptococcus mitis 17/34]|nr:membrane protein [Streptococcus mitis 17/34]